jgi:hypothetical protein
LKDVRAIEGGCHCGAIRYALSAPPEASMICHCRTCRGISGALAIGWISIAADKFAITKGAPKAYASSPNLLREFCGDCGAQITNARAEDDPYVDLTTATLDNPDAFPPTHHSWLSHDIAWVKVGDGLPTFQKSRSDG